MKAESGAKPKATSMAIDREKVRVAIRRMGSEYLHHMLDDAIDFLPPTKLAKLAARYLEVNSLQSNRTSTRAESLTWLTAS